MLKLYDKINVLNLRNNRIPAADLYLKSVEVSII